jgi:DNA-binding ferritin-like protein
MNNTERNQESIAKFNYQIQNSRAQVVLIFFQFQMATKMFHWQTTSYANHKTTDKLFDKLADLTDSFLEKYFGVFGRPSLRMNSSVIVENMTKAKYLKLLTEVDKYLRGPVDKMISNNSELKNIRDEILAEMDQAKYLFTLG